MRYPTGTRRRLLPGGLQGVADLRLLPQHDGWVAVVQHKAQLVDTLSPVERAEDGPDALGVEQRFEQTVAVLSGPHDPVTGTDALGVHRPGQLGDARLQHRPRDPERAAHERRSRRGLGGVLVEGFTEAEGGDGVHRVAVG